MFHNPNRPLSDLSIFPRTVWLKYWPSKPIENVSRFATTLVFSPVTKTKTSSKLIQSRRRFPKNAVRHLKLRNHNVCKRTRDPAKPLLPLFFVYLSFFSRNILRSSADGNVSARTYLSVPPTLTLVWLLLLFRVRPRQNAKT